MIFIEVIFPFLETSLLLLSSLQAPQFTIISSSFLPSFQFTFVVACWKCHCTVQSLPLQEQKKVLTTNCELASMCLDFCLATMRNMGWWGHCALSYSRQRTVHEGANICNEEWFSPMSAGMDGGISTSSHKLSLLLGAKGLPSGGLRVAAFSKDRCQQGAPRAGGHRQNIVREQQVWHYIAHQCKGSWLNDGLWWPVATQQFS